MHVGHSITHVKGAKAHLEPLWSVLDAVESDLAGMKSLQQYFHNREIRNRASKSISAPIQGCIMFRLCTASPRPAALL